VFKVGHRTRETNLEPQNLVFQVISVQRLIAIKPPVSLFQISQPPLPPATTLFLLADQHPEWHASPRNLVSVARSNTLPCRPNLSLATILLARRIFYDPVHRDLQIETHVRPIANQYPFPHPHQALLFQIVQLLEERRDMHDTACAYQVDSAGRVDEARRENVKVIGRIIDNNGMSSIIATCSAAAKRGALGEDIH
jgi:hypothetical protein